MVNKCIISGCKSGYSNASPTQIEDPEKNERKLYFHKFPNDMALCNFWISMVSKDPNSWQPSTSSRNCSKHFNLEDYEEHLMDQKTSRLKRRGDGINMYV